METIFTRLQTDNPFGSAPVFHVEQTDSTMILAREIAEGGFSGVKPVHGTVVTADFQTAGRGRIPGRRWVGEKYKNLLFTLILGKDMVPPGKIPLPLVTGLGLVVYLEERHSLQPVIKWPNDILVSGKKISGIIIEQLQRVYLVGIGINVNQSSFPKDLRRRTTSLVKETGTICSVEKELTGVLEGIRSALKEKNPAPLIEKHLFARGREVTFLSGDPVQGERIQGVLTGIGPGGSLLLRLPDGRTTAAASGEIIY